MMMWTLLVAPTERGAATKTGDYDMAAVLDDSREPRLGEMLRQQQEAQLLDCEVAEDEDEGQEPMWDFGPKAYVDTWKRAVLGLGLEAVCQTPYKARHGGPSRNLQSKLRTEAEVASRGWWKTAASVRNYAKPARMNRIAQQAGPQILEYEERVRKQFARSFLNGFVLPA